MTTLYEKFNEMTFEAYVKAAIDNAIKTERRKKDKRSKIEESLSTLTDAMLYKLFQEDAGIERAEKGHSVFQAWGTDIPVYDERLGQALSTLIPKDREIILSYFFLQAKTDEIAQRMNSDPTTVRRRYKKALQKLRDFLEDTI